MTPPSVPVPVVMSTLVGRLAPFRRTIGTTGGLVLANLATSVTGFAFWWLAARAYPQEAVGLAGAAVSAMVFLSQIAVLGLPTTLAGVLHLESRPTALVASALAAASAVGLALGLAFGILAPVLSDELAPVSDGLPILLLFALGVGATAGSSVLDTVLVAVSKNLRQLGRNVVFSLVRLPLIAVAVLVAGTAGMGLYGAWVVAILLSLVALVVAERGFGFASDVRPLVWGRLRTLTSAALSHHLLNLTRSASVWLLPVLVTVVLSREANANFYVALLVANFLTLIGTSTTFTLYVVGAQAPERLWHEVRFSMAVTAAIAVLGTGVLVLIGHPLLGLFGPRYAEVAYTTLVLLALSTLPLLIKDHWIAVQRLRGSVLRAGGIGFATLVAELAAASLGGLLYGLEGVALGRLLVLFVEAIFMAPRVVRAMRPPSADPAS